MANAKEELLNILVNTAYMKCAVIYDRHELDEDRKIIKLLKVNYTEKEYLDFINGLDFKYDSGFGGQELFGTVWLLDGTWLSRGEYDGSEWWEHNKLPEIPKELL